MIYSVRRFVMLDDLQYQKPNDLHHRLAKIPDAATLPVRHLLRAEQAESGWVVVELRLVFYHSTGFGLVGFGNIDRWRIPPKR
ncbi:La protein [Dirofilaria immitis]